MNNSILSCILIAIFTTCIAVTAVADPGDERAALEKRRHALQKKIGELKREQDELLFRRAFYDTDSKYIVVDLSSGRAFLKYRNRILRDFAFSISSKRAARSLGPGAVTLTQKETSAGKVTKLYFGKTLIIQPTGRVSSSSSERNIPKLLLSKRDLRSIGAALEEGAKVYLVR